MIVVDTNIIAYRWLPGPRSLEADQLTQLDPYWAAPLLWRSEFRNVLAGYMRSGRLAITEAEQAARYAAASLLGGEHAISDESVLELVNRSKCSAYDCEYAALAKALDTVVVTEDRELIRAFPKLCRTLDGFIQSI